jgi:lipoic acid synthetase
VENSDHLERPKMRDPKPNWLKVRAPGGETYARIKQTLRGLDLHTVCEEARCPNVGECWSKGTATVMVLGDVCTRGCRFCAVTSGHPKGVVDAREPENVASAVAALGLKYVVLTMVDRDDLPDGGAAHVRDTVLALRRLSPGLLVETLVGDFAGDFSCVDTVLSGGPSVYGHNIEVVRRLTPLVRDRRCSFDRSLDLLSYARKKADEKPQNDEPNSEKWTRYVKSSLMVGVGETDDEVVEAMADLRKAGVDIVTLGQYLRPSPKHLPVDRYVTPEQFERWQTIGQTMGFAFVASGPLVRSSYHAAEAFVFAAEGESGTPDPVVSLPTGLVEPQRLLQKNRNSV